MERKNIENKKWKEKVIFISSAKSSKNKNFRGKKNYKLKGTLNPVTIKYLSGAQTVIYSVRETGRTNTRRRTLFQTLLLFQPKSGFDLLRPELPP